MDAYCCLRTPYKQAKPAFREDLSKVIDSFPGPWLGIGDFNEITNTKDKKGEALDQTQKEDPSTSNLERKKNLQCNLDEELKREESLWQNWSRYKRILEGDLNTKFFHLTTIIRRRRNAIEFIKDGEGTWIIGTNQVGRCFNNHFEQTFSTCKPTFPPDFENLLTHSISEADNLLMCAIPTDSEIEKALNHMGSYKAPGPDGMTALFFKTYRKITSFDVKESVKNFFITGHILKEQNHTLIALIQKQDNPVSVNHYRPISLCNVSYKLISKILASRLQAILHQLVSPLQAAFVPKRLINDNSIIVQELWQTMRKKKGKNGLMAIKIDMEKAYDKMEWSFILNVLKNFGFDQKWIGWVEQCISTATFSTLINGQRAYTRIQMMSAKDSCFNWNSCSALLIPPTSIIWLRIATLSYPHCLFFLELLQNANFRVAMARPGNKEMAHRQQIYFGKNYRNTRLKHILRRSLPEPVAAPQASEPPPAPLQPIVNNVTGASVAVPIPPASQVLSPMKYGMPPSSVPAKNESKSSGSDQRKWK
ncbi:hypothetical protein RJ639_013237 [Escallonia herrerae]|uniref:Reverse transcriptase domain-containing protein n=1 Tax=Escallonia herrerae TaxID=1293975 RepID=A0AA89AKQ5_9ASTE|nr:hypothetical protein RJ639_013237 [Escallonia herrerae]